MSRIFYVRPNQELFYCEQSSGSIKSVRVAYVGADGFVVRYNGKIYELPHSALGSRLFLTAQGAAHPCDVGKDKPRYAFYGFPEDCFLGDTSDDYEKHDRSLDFESYD